MRYAGDKALFVKRFNTSVKRIASQVLDENKLTLQLFLAGGRWADGSPGGARNQGGLSIQHICFVHTTNLTLKNFAQPFLFTSATRVSVRPGKKTNAESNPRRWRVG